MKHLLSAILLLAATLLSCKGSSEGTQSGTDQLDTDTIATETENDYVIVGEDSISCNVDTLSFKISQLLTLSIDSGKRDNVILNYPSRIVIEADKTSDTISITSNAVQAINKVSIQKNNAVPQEDASDEDENNPTPQIPIYIWFIAAGVVVIWFVFMKREKKVFKIRMLKEPKIIDEIPYWCSKSGLKQDKAAKKQYCGEIEIMSKDICREMMIAWLIKYYYCTDNKNNINNIRDCINNLSDRNDANNSQRLIFPLMPDKDTNHNSKGKKAKNNDEVKCKNVPDAIQKLDYEMGMELKREYQTLNQGKATDAKEIDKQAHSIIDRMVEEIEDDDERRIVTDSIRRFRETETQLANKELEVTKLRNEKDRLSNDLKTAQENTQMAVEKATQRVSEENKKLQTSVDTLTAEKKALESENGRLNTDLTSANNQIKELNEEITSTRDQFTVQKECKPFAINLKNFFELLNTMNYDAESVMCRLTSEAGNGMLAMAKAYENYLSAFDRSRDTTNALSLDSSLIAKTGFDLTASELNKRLISQQSKAAREKDFRYFVYERLNGLMGEAVKFADIVKHLSMSHGVEGDIIANFKDMPERLIAAITLLGYKVEYVELFTPYNIYKDVEVVDNTEDAVFEPDTVTEVREMAVNYGTSSKKTKVIAKI